MASLCSEFAWISRATGQRIQPNILTTSKLSWFFRIEWMYADWSNVRMEVSWAWAEILQATIQSHRRWRSCLRMELPGSVAKYSRLSFFLCDCSVPEVKLSESVEFVAPTKTPGVVCFFSKQMHRCAATGCITAVTETVGVSCRIPEARKLVPDSIWIRRQENGLPRLRRFFKHTNTWHNFRTKGDFFEGNILTLGMNSMIGNCDSPILQQLRGCCLIPEWSSCFCSCCGHRRMLHRTSKTSQSLDISKCQHRQVLEIETLKTHNQSLQNG